MFIKFAYLILILTLYKKKNQEFISNEKQIFYYIPSKCEGLSQKMSKDVKILPK